MKGFIAFWLAIGIILGAALTASATTSRHHDGKWGMTPAKMAPVMRVHRCEQPSSWHVRGMYPGGLGWLDSTWQGVRAGMIHSNPRFRGLPMHANLATPWAQGRAMHYFVKNWNHGYWPHQRACDKGGY